jgi:hypothetical protein
VPILGVAENFAWKARRQVPGASPKVLYLVISGAPGPDSQNDVQLLGDTNDAVTAVMDAAKAVVPSSNLPRRAD